MNYAEKVQKLIEKKDIQGLIKLASKADERELATLVVDYKNLAYWAIDNKQYDLIRACCRNQNFDINQAPNGRLFVNALIENSGDPEIKSILKGVLGRRDVNVNLLAFNAGVTPLISAALKADDDVFKWALAAVKDIDVSSVEKVFSIVIDTDQQTKFDMLMNKRGFVVPNNCLGTAFKQMTNPYYFDTLFSREDLNLEMPRGEVYEELVAIERGRETKEEFTRRMDLLLADKRFNVNISYANDILLNKAYDVDKELFHKLLAHPDTTFEWDDKNHDTILSKVIKEGDYETAKHLLKQNKRLGLDYLYSNPVRAAGAAMQNMAKGIKGSEEILDLIFARKDYNINLSDEYNSAVVCDFVIAVNTKNDAVIEKVYKKEDLIIDQEGFKALYNTANFDVLGKAIMEGKYSFATEDIVGNNGIVNIFKIAKDEKDMEILSDIVFLGVDHKDIQSLLNHENDAEHSTILSIMETDATAKMLGVFLKKMVEKVGFVDIDFNKAQEIISKHHNEPELVKFGKLIESYQKKYEEYKDKDVEEERAEQKVDEEQQENE